jgi:hypothetical protein
MSYQETNITVTLFSYLMLMGYYLINISQMQQTGGLQAGRVYGLWATVIIAGIVINIVGAILTNIVLSIVHAIRTRSDKEPRFVEDERDRLIELKGSRFAYIAFSLGVVGAMLTFVAGHPPLVMFSAIIFASLVGEIIGSAWQLYLYRRGV